MCVRMCNICGNSEVCVCVCVGGGGSVGEYRRVLLSFI